VVVVGRLHLLGRDWVRCPPTTTTTSRHDLSQRQLIIREMLNHPDGTLRIPEEVVNRAWRWRDGMNSMITLPSEDSSAAQVPASP
jgi:hypothetical protein